MPVAIVEIVGSRATTVSIDNPSMELAFTAKDSFDEHEVRIAVELQLPNAITMTSKVFGVSVSQGVTVLSSTGLIIGDYTDVTLGSRTLVLQEYQIKQRQEGGKHWDGTARYGKRIPRQTGDLILSFDSTGGTQHVTTSKGTVDTYKRGDSTAEIPDCQNAIGCNGETVEGCDITVPVFKFVYDWYPRSDDVTPEYIINLMRMTGSTNDDVWKGFSTGEVLFLGATGAPRGFEDWEIKLHFIASPDVIFVQDDPNNPGLTVGEISGITKHGHDYLWVRFADAVTASALVKQPAFVYTEQVYDRKDFTLLGIGE